MKLIDLTRTIYAGMQENKEQQKTFILHDNHDNYKLIIDGTCGTHISGNTNFERYIGRAICLDISFLLEDQLTVDALKRSMSRIKINSGDIVLFYSLKKQRLEIISETMKLLLAAGVSIIGTDAERLIIQGDYKIPIIEKLENLIQLINKNFLYVGLPLKIDRVSKSPLRAVAVIGE